MHSRSYPGAKSEETIVCRSWILQNLFMLVNTGIYSYILVHTVTHQPLLGFESGWSRLALLSRLHLVQCIAHSILPLCSLLIVDGQTPPGGACRAQTATATANLLDIAAQPAEILTCICRVYTTSI
jgi:hypothetical protein